MNQEAWVSILNKMCDKNEDECELGIGKRKIDPRETHSLLAKKLYVSTNTISSAQIASNIHTGLVYLAEVVRNPESDRWDEFKYDDDTQPQVFILDSVYLKNSNALIGWQRKSMIVIPWENITSIWN